MLSKIGSFLSNCNARLAMVLCMLLAMGGNAFALEGDVVTLPDSGSNVTGHISAAILALGAILAVVVGGYFVFLIVRKGMRWAGKIG